MGDYKVLHTFSPSFELWGVSSTPLTDGGIFHARVLYLAMVEYPNPGGTPFRQVLAFDADNDEVNIDEHAALSAPCNRVPPDTLECVGHQKTGQS